MGFMDQFNQQQQTRQPSTTMLKTRLDSIKKAANGDVAGFISYMRQTNPEFDAFAQSMQGKTPEQAFSEYGLDYSQFMGIL